MKDNLKVSSDKVYLMYSCMHHVLGYFVGHESVKKVKRTTSFDSADHVVVPFLSTVSSCFIFVLALSQFRRPDYLGERNKQGLLEKGNDPLRDTGNQKLSIEREVTVLPIPLLYGVHWYEN